MRPIPLIYFLSTTLFYSGVSASIFTSHIRADERKFLGDYENCGTQPAQPNFIGSLYNSSQKKAINNFIECNNRNNTRKSIDFDSEMNTLFFNTREACEGAIRKLSSNPSTLSFKHGDGYSAMKGLNGAGVETTDGGYSVRVSGSDIQGSFNVMCYMNKSFIVTNVR